MVTRNWSAESYKRDSINRILQEDEAAEMASNVADDSGAHANHEDGDDEGDVPVVEAFQLWQPMNIFTQSEDLVFLRFKNPGLFI